MKRNLFLPRGKRSTYFYILLSGNVEAYIGEEQLEASYGPFRCLGVQALMKPDVEYYPDYIPLSYQN